MDSNTHPLPSLELPQFLLDWIQEKKRLKRKIYRSLDPFRQMELKEELKVLNQNIRDILYEIKEIHKSECEAAQLPSPPGFDYTVMESECERLFGMSLFDLRDSVKHFSADYANAQDDESRRKAVYSIADIVQNRPKMEEVVQSMQSMQIGTEPKYLTRNVNNIDRECKRLFGVCFFDLNKCLQPFVKDFKNENDDVSKKNALLAFVLSLAKCMEKTAQDNFAVK